MSFAPPTTMCDVGFELKNGDMLWVAKGVDVFTAEDYAFHPDRPKGSRFVCKVRGRA